MSFYRTFAKDEIKHNPKRRVHRSALFFLTFCMLLIGNGCLSYIRTQQRQAFAHYGEWNRVIFNVEQKDVETAKKANLDTVLPLPSLGQIMVKNQDGYAQIGEVSQYTKEAMDLFHLELLDGSYPQKNNDIIIEADVLSYLGYSYQLHQSIQLLLSDGKMHKFHLTGIIKPYRSMWNVQDSNSLSAAFVKAKGSLSSLWLKDVRVNEDYPSIPGISAINTYAYDNMVWLNGNSSRFLIGMMFALCMILVFMYFIIRDILMSYEKEDHILKQLGASRKQIQWIRFWFFIYLLRLPILCAYLLYYGGSTLGSDLLNDTLHIEVVASWYVGGIFLLGLLLTILLANLLTNRKQEKMIKKTHIHKLTIRHPWKKITPWRLAWRNLTTLSHHTVIIIVLHVIVLSTFLLCIQTQANAYMQWQDYQKRRGIGDYRASFNVNPESKKIRELDITGLKSIPHVTSVRAFHIRSDIKISYANMQQETCLKDYQTYYHYTNVIPDTHNTYATLIAINEDATVIPIMQKYLNFDEKAFLNGDLAIINTEAFIFKKNTGSENGYSTTDYLLADGTREQAKQDGGNYHEIQYIHKGTMLTLTGKHTMKMKALPMKNKFSDMVDALGEDSGIPFTIFLSEKGYANIMGEHLGYQSLVAETDKKADYHHTDQQVMNILSRYGDLHITNSRLEEEIHQQKFLQTVLLYGVIEVFICFLWLLLLSNQYRLHQTYLDVEHKLLRILGVSKSYLLCTAFLEAIVQAIISLIITACLYWLYEKIYHPLTTLGAPSSPYYLPASLIWHHHVPLLCILLISFLSLSILLKGKVGQEKGRDSNEIA